MQDRTKKPILKANKILKRARVEEEDAMHVEDDEAQTMQNHTKRPHLRIDKNSKRVRVEEDNIEAMDVDGQQETGNTFAEPMAISDAEVDTLSTLHSTLDNLRGARADVRRALAETGARTEAVEKAGDTVKVSTQDRERLEVIGKELRGIVDKTGLPVHILLQHTGLLIRWTRGQNSWNLYQEYVRTQNRKIPFEIFSSVVKTEYDELKKRSFPQQWKNLKETWRDAVTKDWMSKVTTVQHSASRDNASMVKHMSQIVTQFSELQGNIRNGAPIEMITLVYSSDPHMRQLSQFLVSDPNIRPLFESQQIATREMIERFITLSNALALGITSFEPDEMSLEDLLSFAADVEKESDSKPVDPTEGNVSRAGSSGITKAENMLDHQIKGVKPGANSSKPSKASGVDSIRDYRGYIKRFTKNGELPDGLSLDCDRDGLRSVIRLLLKSLFADATGVANPNIWGTCIHLFLIKHKIRFVWPSEPKGKDRPGDPHWDPKYWSSSLMREAIDWIGGRADKHKKKVQYVYIEEWSEDEKLLPTDSNHPLYLDIPIIRSPSRNSKILATVRECQELVLHTHIELERKSSNAHTQPLTRTTEIRKLKEDIKIYLEGHTPNTVPKYHNVEYLNQVLIRYCYPPIQVAVASTI
ncbi:hypothetical protein EST38_g4772 [Candolleomyces aberdarensis]|uniref:Uncharacterized protein n=1 Tax=Candolleomyces aberdarensis TaxID=2316362 RepID=A0A4Q2DMB7_9AGAR|nr:hypothetical protein EST38_g4772 [Candolleomyces aberdarensis]